ncbi:MAG: sialidase family protein, partial [Acidimicrobiaceae bacterium]
MRRNFLLGLVIASVTVISLGHSASAVFVDPNQRDCLNRKFGTKAAAAISKAKKLTTAQAKQVSACSGPGGQSSSGGASGSSGSSSSSLTALSWGLMWSVGSNQAGLGNVSDPALVQLGDGSLRMFFKNGNSPQIPLSGFDNKIHSYVSSDNGATWTLESGVRIDVGSPVTVRAAEAGGYEAWGWIPGGGGVEKMTRFTSSTGKDFSQGSGSLVPTSACKNADGAAAGFLGDPQVVKVASGYLAYAHDLAAGKSAPFKRQACKLTSVDGNTWSIDSSGTFALNYDIQSNPELYRNSAGQLELWFPADNGGSKTFEIRTS